MLENIASIAYSSGGLMKRSGLRNRSVFDKCGLSSCLRISMHSDNHRTTLEPMSQVRIDWISNWLYFLRLGQIILRRCTVNLFRLNYQSYKFWELTTFTPFRLLQSRTRNFRDPLVSLNAGSSKLNKARRPQSSCPKLI